MLKELNVSYNRLSRVPPELGTCEDLERLELTGNHLSELPFEVREQAGVKSTPALPVASVALETTQKQHTQVSFW